MSGPGSAEWTKLKELFTEVMSAPAADRAVAVDRACGGDREIRERLLTLIGGTDPQKDVVGRLGEALDQSLALADVPERWIGSSVDGYRLVELLGRGGMGAVYRGKAADGGPAVAVKLLAATMPSKTARKRFAREVDRLSALDHPGVASLLGRGVLPAGEPYYVMELVEGERIDAYADRCGLGVAERVSLLIEVGAAVQHAHGKRIIHRDLKPSNILVRPTGEPVLLDFGIAKLLDPIHGGRPATLTLEALAYTPGYSSPEQVAGDPVSAASDVYSLGAVGYTLLAGAPPPVTVQREPRRLLRVFEMQGERRSELASARGMTVEDLASELAGELTDVLLCACELDVRARYPSVEALVGELERYLAG